MKIDRNRIIKYAVIFLAIMLLFTVISSKISYMITPEISAATPGAAGLSYRLTADGEIRDGKVIFWLNMEKEPYLNVRDIPMAEFSNIRASLRLVVEEKQFDEQSQMMKYTCALNNDSGREVYEGQACWVSFDYSLGSYDLVLPKECIIRSGGKAYVYRIGVSSTVMGKQSIVRLVEVTVLAEDDYSIALSGGITHNDSVARYYSKPLSDRQQVRVTE